MNLGPIQAQNSCISVGVSSLVTILEWSSHLVSHFQTTGPVNSLDFDTVKSHDLSAHRYLLSLCFPPCWIHVHVVCFVFTHCWQVSQWWLSWLPCGYDRFILHALSAENQGAARRCSTILEKDFVWGCEKHLQFGYIFSSKINRYLKFLELLFFFDLSVSLTWIELTLLCLCLLSFLLLFCKAGWANALRVTKAFGSPLAFMWLKEHWV